MEKISTPKLSPPAFFELETIDFLFSILIEILRFSSPLREKFHRGTGTGVSTYFWGKTSFIFWGRRDNYILPKGHNASSDPSWHCFVPSHIWFFDKQRSSVKHLNCQLLHLTEIVKTGICTLGIRGRENFLLDSLHNVDFWSCNYQNLGVDRLRNLESSQKSLVTLLETVRFSKS